MQATCCLTCRERVVYRRGCCMRCHERHRTTVVRGKVTWAELAERGLVTPAQPIGTAWRQSWWERTPARM